MFCGFSKIRMSHFQTLCLYLHNFINFYNSSKQTTILPIAFLELACYIFTSFWLSVNTVASHFISKHRMVFPDVIRQVYLVLNMIFIFIRERYASYESQFYHFENFSSLKKCLCVILLFLFDFLWGCMLPRSEDVVNYLTLSYGRIQDVCLCKI